MELILFMMLVVAMAGYLTYWILVAAWYLLPYLGVAAVVIGAALLAVVTIGV